jgi:uncharacterized membrane protein YgdD (TMEM256/DUF423 family)
MVRPWLFLGALSGLLAVGLSAYAAHGLRALDPSAREAIASALTMQFWHAVALIAAALWAPRGGVLTQAAAACFALGAVLFCGAVWWGTMSPPAPPRVAPAGGLVLMAGWALLAASALKRA